MGFDLAGIEFLRFFSGHESRHQHHDLRGFWVLTGRLREDLFERLKRRELGDLWIAESLGWEVPTFEFSELDSPIPGSAEW